MKKAVFVGSFGGLVVGVAVGYTLGLYTSANTSSSNVDFNALDVQGIFQFGVPGFVS
jgi:hypothetical protein